MKPNAFARAAAAALVAATAGCATRYYRPGGRSRAPAAPAYVVKPVVAVMDFENRSGFEGQWKLGGGMADLLVTGLLDTGRVTVLERRDLDDVLAEIARQGRDFFRREGRVDRGRLKNARYMLRGVVTEFTVTGDVSGWFAAPAARAFGRGQRARVALNVRLYDVESGEVLASVRTDGSVSSGLFGGSFDYRGVTFGGDAFFRTPLGRATEAAMARAVDGLLEAVPARYWQPRVAESGPDAVIVNGGENVGLRPGAEFTVRSEGRAVTDPITGDVIETVPGPARGRIRVTGVRAASSHAVLLEGDARRGDVLWPAP